MMGSAVRTEAACLSLADLHYRLGQHLQADIAETSRLMDAAWASFREHRSAERYRAECKAIVAREDALEQNGGAA